MEASPLSTPETEDWAEQLDQSLTLQRDRVREFLDAQQERLERVEGELGSRLEQFADEVSRNRNDFQQAKEGVQQRSERIARETQALEALKEELSASQAEWKEFQERAGSQQQALAEHVRQQQDQLDRCREELTKRQSEIDAAEAKLHHAQRALELARQEHQAEQERTSALREQLQAGQAELDARREQLDARQAHTESQRRRIAREIKAQHAIQLRELERRRAELQQRDGSEQLALRRQLEAAQTQQAELAAEVKALHQQREDLEGELKSLQGKCDQLKEKLARRPADGGADAEALRTVEAQRDELARRLEETEGRLAETRRSLAESQKGGVGDDSADEDTQRRYEMALEDLRDLKAQNAKLQEQLTQARAAHPAISAAGGALDWEAEKKRILAALESDSDDGDIERQAELLKIEEVIRETDLVLAEKGRECDELRQLLENQSSNLGSVAVGAAALGEVLDSDAIVQEERENLKNLQQQWREKLRQAEVDISIERATLARERAEIEAKLHTIEKRDGKPEGGPNESTSPEKPARGRWRERLGLKDESEK